MRSDRKDQTRSRPEEKHAWNRNSLCTGLIGMCSEYLRDKERTSRLECREEGSMLRKKAGEPSRGQNSQGRARVWV